MRFDIARKFIEFCRNFIQTYSPYVSHAGVLLNLFIMLRMSHTLISRNENFARKICNKKKLGGDKKLKLFRSDFFEKKRRLTEILFDELELTDRREEDRVSNPIFGATF